MVEWQMVMLLDEVVRISPDRLRCRIIREGAPAEFTVHFTRPDDELRGLTIEGMSVKETWELSNRDEFKALMRTLWAYADGGTLTLPQQVEAGLSGASEA